MTAAGALVVVIVVQLVDLSGRFEIAPYLGVASIAVITVAMVAIGMLLGGDGRGWALGVALSLVTLAAFVASRTIGLPAAGNDVGNWGDRLDLASVVAEAAVISLAASSLIVAHDPPRR